MNDPLIESAKEIEALREKVTILTQERNVNWNNATENALRLVYAQARIKELREALEKRMASENRWPDYIIEALATPDDSSALDAALKAERERIAEWCDAQPKSDWYGRTAGDMIRSMK